MQVVCACMLALTGHRPASKDHPSNYGLTLGRIDHATPCWGAAGEEGAARRAVGSGEPVQGQPGAPGDA